MARLHLAADRALPAEAGTRALAREILGHTEHLPLVCMHGHVDAAVLADDQPFGDPAGMLITPDHYLTRMVHSAGVPLERLGIPPRAPAGGPTATVGGPGGAGGEVASPREVWRTFCAHWHLFRGTPTRFWLTHELVEVFGVTEAPSTGTADVLYDQIQTRLGEPAFRPRALFERFGIELLATTDPACSGLTDHARLAGTALAGRVIPTFRPDSLLAAGRPGWAAEVDELGKLTTIDTGDYAGYLAALRARRADFIAAGALATDHGHESTDTTPLPWAEAARLYAAARRGRLSAAAAAAFTGHMLHETARMSCEDGLVMQLHPGVLRDHAREVAARYGPDRGFDIPVRTEFTRGLRPLLESFGRVPGFRLVLFTVDETGYSRELAPLAGVYPAVLLGAPWWFLDSPDGIRRYREAVTETAGFYNTAGFVDDTRAFASIPARHNLARRVDAGYLARLVAEHRLELDEAIETAVDLAYRLPKQVYARPESG